MNFLSKNVLSKHKDFLRWVEIAKALFLQAFVTVVLLVGAVAFKNGKFGIVSLIIAIIAIIMIHPGLNTPDDYHDQVFKVDEVRIRATPFQVEAR